MQSWIRIPLGARGCLLLQISRPALGYTQPPIQWIPRLYLVELKRPGREFNHALLCSAGVKNEWSYMPPWGGKNVTFR